LTTDILANDIVNSFYLRNGWTIESELTAPEGLKMFRYGLDFE
jgi:hypothetical protein